MPNSPQIINHYQSVVQAAALHVRTDRGLLEIRGKDRVGWLSNLVTNILKTLQPGDGNYAFATNVKGRTVFDANILLLDDRLWLDIDHRLIARATDHLNRYVVTEDVAISDVSSSKARLALIGPVAHEIVARLGLGNLVPMPHLQHRAVRLAGEDVHLIRNDFAGLPTADFVFPSAGMEAVASALDATVHGGKLPRVEHEVIEILRIEHGIPASVDDIDEDVVPPETGQIERGISYHKGCYLGQEVIERMRSHGVLARKLAGLKLQRPLANPDGLPPRNTPVFCDEREIGRITSACWSERLSAPLALGYLKSQYAGPRHVVELRIDAPAIRAEVVELPLPSVPKGRTRSPAE